MKELKVARLDGSHDKNDIGNLSNKLDSCNRNALAYTPWSEGNPQAIVHFAMAYSPSNIFLKYFVEEKTIRAVNNTANSAVWEDSCVEFFISFGDEGYYNIEFNCIGTACIGYGSQKENRAALSETFISAIKTRSDIVRNNENGNISWELTVSIPLTTFVHTSINDLKEKQCHGNFYKCGDLLPEPHFICWNNIQSSCPDFHLPRYFGKIVFV